MSSGSVEASCPSLAGTQSGERSVSAAAVYGRCGIRGCFQSDMSFLEREQAVVFRKR